MKPKTAVLFTSGTNCEFETLLSFKMAKSEAILVHTNELMSANQLNNFQIIAIPGGFSYGDHLGSATVWSNELEKVWGDWVAKFLASGKLVIGICNGFQILTKLGVVPNTGGESCLEAVLTHNASSKFESRWVKLKVNPKSPCIFTRDLSLIDMPVAHEEGSFHPKDLNIYNSLVEGDQVAVQYADVTGCPTDEYPDNPNGSFAAIAGVCDVSGRAFGLMPHPERFIFPYQNAKSHFENKVLGLSIFENAVGYFK